MAPPLIAKSEPPPAQPVAPEATAQQPLVSVVPAEAQVAATVRKNELRSSTLIGIAPVTEPSEPPPSVDAGPSAVENEPAQREVTRAQSDAPPANSSPPLGPTSRQTPAAAFARQMVPSASDAPSPSKVEERVASASEEAPAPKRSGASIALLAAAGLAVGILGYRALHRSGPPPDLAALPATSTLPAPATASPSAEPAQPASTSTAPSATAADFHAAPPAPLDSPTDAKPLASAEAAPSAAPAASASASPAGVIRVTVTSSPPKAKFFHYGKEVGTAPFVIDLQPGEKHAYEVWLPGHVTRKVFVDGSKSEINIGLREEK